MNIICEVTIGELISGVILGVTAIIIFWYTRAVQKSNEIQEKPILNLYLRESKVGPNTQYTLRLRNVGRGPAYNIKFYPIRADNFTYYPIFQEPNPILERDRDEKTVDMWVATPKSGVEVYDSITGFQRLLMRLFPRQVGNDEQELLKRSAAIFLINYEGVNGKEYYSIFRLYSKIWPLLRVYDLVVEFVTSGNGKCDIKEARRICESRKTMRKLEK